MEEAHRLESEYASMLQLFLHNQLGKSLQDLVYQDGIHPQHYLLYLGEVPYQVLQPILRVEKELKPRMTPYLEGKSSRRVTAIPKEELTRVLRSPDFVRLINDNQSHLTDLPIDLLHNSRGISGGIHYYLPSEDPLEPHVDSGEFAIVIGLHFHEQSHDDSLRWLDPRNLVWRPVQMRIGSVVLIPCGVLHMVRRPLAGERATIIIMVQVLIPCETFDD
jgi:hypothetical protein